MARTLLSRRYDRRVHKKGSIHRNTWSRMFYCLSSSRRFASGGPTWSMLRSFTSRMMVSSFSIFT